MAPHSTASTVPTRAPYSRSPTAKIPQAASSAQPTATATPTEAREPGVTPATAFTTTGYSGKNARLLSSEPFSSNANE